MAKDKENTTKKAEERVMVIIPKPDDIIGDTETVVGVNGKMHQIQYDRPVEVPRNVAEVIQSSADLRAEIIEATEAAIMKPGKPELAEL